MPKSGYSREKKKNKNGDLHYISTSGQASESEKDSQVYTAQVRSSSGWKFCHNNFSDGVASWLLKSF
jgi:hypothetical protein